MHRLIDEHPRMVEFHAQQAKAAGDRDKWEAEAKRRHEAYTVACVEALEKGTTIPEAPQNAQAGHHAYRVRLEQIDQAKQAWLNENAAELLDQILAREDEIVEATADMVARIDAHATEMDTLLATARELHRRKVGPGGDTNLRSPGSNVELLIASARNGTRLCREPFTDDRRAAGQTWGAR